MKKEQLYKTTQLFGKFLESFVSTTLTRLKPIELDVLLESNAVKVILDGVLDDGNFLLKEN